jgi:hypothetical protein
VKCKSPVLKKAGFFCIPAPNTEEGKPRFSFAHHLKIKKSDETKPNYSMISKSVFFEGHIVAENGRRSGPAKIVGIYTISEVKSQGISASSCADHRAFLAAPGGPRMTPFV